MARSILSFLSHPDFPQVFSEAIAAEMRRVDRVLESHEQELVEEVELG